MKDFVATTSALNEMGLSARSYDAGRFFQRRLWMAAMESLLAEGDLANDYT